MTTESLTTDVVDAANSMRRRLQELLQAPAILNMPGAFNPLSALLFQHLGFPAVQGSSSAIANALGYADLDIGREATVSVTGQMAAAVSVPVNADGEDGFGGPGEVRETVRRFVAAGAAGMNMEDGDKTERGRLVELPKHMEKIAAFMEARRELGSEFLLNARSDAFMVIRDDPAQALAEAVRRGQAFAEAGADSVFFWGVADAEAIRTLVKEVPAPVSILAVPGVPGARELEEMGVARVSYGGAFLRVAVAAVRRAAAEILENQTHETLAEAMSGADMKAILGERRT
jgi:2-methylisocitrate lyase-like PEP mutase family enzyme